MNILVHVARNDSDFNEELSFINNGIQFRAKSQRDLGLTTAYNDLLLSKCVNTSSNSESSTRITSE